MGTHRSTYIGPYLVVKDSTITNTIVEYFHPETGKKMKTKFDPNTGTEGVEKTRTENLSRENSPWDFTIDGFSEDDFFKPAYSGAPKGYTTWVCNFSKYSPELDTDDEFNIDISSFDMGIIRGNFLSHYKDYFNKLIEMGIEFEICYGIVNYAH